MIFIHKRVEIDHIFELVCILYNQLEIQSIQIHTGKWTCDR